MKKLGSLRSKDVELQPYMYVCIRTQIRLYATANNGRATAVNDKQIRGTTMTVVNLQMLWHC